MHGASLWTVIGPVAAEGGCGQKCSCRGYGRVGLLYCHAVGVRRDFRALRRHAAPAPPPMDNHAACCTGRVPIHWLLLGLALFTGNMQVMVSCRSGSTVPLPEPAG